MALYVATHGPRQRLHVHRAKELMLSCLWSFNMLASEGFIDRAMLAEAERRLEQILAGIDQLAVSPVEKWLSLSLPAMASAGVDAPTPPLEGVIERVAAAVRMKDFRGETPKSASAPLVLRQDPKRGRRRKC
jgi:hypothetical protein